MRRVDKILYCCKSESEKIILSNENIITGQHLDEGDVLLLKEQSGEVSDTVTRLMMSATYMHYNKGFFDGMKLAMNMSNL